MAAAVSIHSAADGREYDSRAYRRVIRVLTPSGNYATGGESLTAAQFGLRRIIGVNLLNGSVAAASTPTTGEVVGFIVASNGRSVTMRFYESGASGAALAEKTNAEAPPTGQSLTVEVIGY